jgi:hypothetical protein
VVLDTLTPAERLTFVLHDMFAVPFEEIAPMIERSPAAARQLASRAAAGSKGAPRLPTLISRTSAQLAGAFFAAARNGNFDALAVLDPTSCLAWWMASSGRPLISHQAAARAWSCWISSGLVSPEFLPEQVAEQVVVVVPVALPVQRNTQRIDALQRLQGVADLLVSRAALQSGPLVRSSTAVPWWLVAGLAAGFCEFMTRPPGVRGGHLTCGRTA